MYKFIIPNTLPSNNDYIRENRKNIYAGNQMKQDNQAICEHIILNKLRGVQIYHPIVIDYVFYEKDRRRDLDNIASFAMKVIQDSLVACGVIRDDAATIIKAFSCRHEVDCKNPRIEVLIVEREEV